MGELIYLGVVMPLALAAAYPVVLIVVAFVVALAIVVGIRYRQMGRSAPRAARTLRAVGWCFAGIGVAGFPLGIWQSVRDCHTGHDGLCMLVGTFLSSAATCAALLGGTCLLVGYLLPGRRA